MRAEQLAHKFWLALDSPKGEFVQAAINGASIIAKIRTYDAFTCVAENLTVQWETTRDWDELLGQCEKGLKMFHPEFALVERDDLNRSALFRSPVSRNLYWEAKLQLGQTATLTISRYQPQERGQRTIASFPLTEEQLVELLEEVLK
ncbi:hypothetical protein [Fervidibacter sacchari]|jgi:hypothetical protein